MSILNHTTNSDLGFRVIKAGNFVARLTGLVGFNSFDTQAVFYIEQCSGVHTFGMKYPIDIVFLDSEGYVVKVIRNLKPNRITQIIPSASRVLEFASNTLHNKMIEAGDMLDINPEENYCARLDSLRNLLHWPANCFISLLWSVFVLSSFNHWQENGGILGIGLLLVNSILLLLFLTRRKSKAISSKYLDWIIPLATVSFSMFLRPNPSSNDFINLFSISIQFIGLTTILGSLFSLGRSFGVIPANRKIKNSGCYKIVRHPLYTSELIFYVGFLIGNFTPVNLTLLLLIVTGQIYRAISEESLLSKDQGYLEYMGRVKYRFLPGFL